MAIGLYILVNGNPEPTNDVALWGIEFEKDRVIKFDKFDESVCFHISTVFLGGSKPMLFETMVFGGDHDGYTLRYSSMEEAIAGHRLTINMVDRRGFRDKLINEILKY